MQSDPQEWSLAACVEQVLSLRGADACETGKVVLSALATTTHLPGEVRFDAMRLARAGRAGELFSLVSQALDEESKRRLAKKALAGLSAPSDGA